MPANLPPQYFQAASRLKTTQDPEEKVSILEEMLAICPKHKGTEKLQKDLKVKIAKLKKQSTSKKKVKKELLYVVKKEGVGQIVIIGPANGGKSTLLNSLTNAKAKVADYPFTTTIPQPAMMPYENVLLQLIDTPPLTKDFSPGWLKEILKNADGLLVLFDLSEKDLEEKIKEFKEILKNLNLENKKMLFAGNKIDLLSPEESTRVGSLQIKKISAKKGIGLEDLKKDIFDLLTIIKVYTKGQGKEPDFSHPFTLKKGSKLLDLADEIHQDLVQRFKYARLFKKDSKKSLIVGKDYLLEDGDVIEIHT